MTESQWESLCDGCGLCCLHKAQDRGGRVTTFAVACRLLDLETTRCADYARRRRQVPDCVQLRPGRIPADWLPASCAYVLVARGQDLPEWHHLVCGDPEAVHRNGISARGRVVSEGSVRRGRPMPVLSGSHPSLAVVERRRP